MSAKSPTIERNPRALQTIGSMLAGWRHVFSKPDPGVANDNLEEDTGPTEKSATKDKTFAVECQRALAELHGRGERSPKAAVRLFEPAPELLARIVPADPWLVRHLLLERAVTVICADPKSLKTWAALELGVAIATGTPAFGRFEVPKPGSVALFLAEDDERSIQRRLRALAKQRGDSVNLERMFVECRSTLSLEAEHDVARLIASCRLLPETPSLVVLDPLRDLHQADENDSGAMARIMASLRTVRDVLNCAVLVIHHSGKKGQENAGRRAGQTLRGSSAIHGAIDGGIYLQAPHRRVTEDGLSVLSNSALVELKSARGAEGFPLSLTLQDDTNGEVLSAVWSCSDLGQSQSKHNQERTVKKVVQVLRAEMEQTLPGQTVKGLSQGMIRERAHIGTKPTIAALEAALGQGLIKNADHRWVYVVPAEQSTPATDTTDTHPLRGSSECGSVGCSVTSKQAHQVESELGSLFETIQGDQ